MSYASRPEDLIPASKLREFLDHQGWDWRLVRQAREAKLICLEDAVPRLGKLVRPLFSTYIDPDTDRIGHTFPTSGSRDHKRTRAQDNGLIGVEWESSVNAFLPSLITGAAVIGVQRTVALVAGWIQERPIEYQTSAILHGRPPMQALRPAAGINMGGLPRSVDELPVSLRTCDEISADIFLGRIMVAIDTTVSPPLFRPNADHLKHEVHADAVSGLDIATVCQALSLVSNDYVDAGFCWHDYGELSRFSLYGSGTHWLIGPAGFANRPYASLSLNRNPNTGRTSFVMEEGRGPDLDNKELAETLNTLADLRGDQHHESAFTAIGRWMKSKDPYENMADRFIDLRIALESLYSLGSQSELRARVALSGAWHLGANVLEREKIHKTLRDAYDRASSAVHGSWSVETRDDRNLLSNAQDLCRRAIFKLIDEGVVEDGSAVILRN